MFLCIEKKYMKIFITVLLFFILTSFAEFPPETPWSGTQTITNLANPNYLQTVRDTVYNVNITRISDETVFGKSGGAIQHQYSKVQAWNCDMSLISLGFTTILDASDYSLIGTLEIGMSLVDGRWSNVYPEIRYFCDGEYLKKVNVLTKEVTTLHRFDGYVTCRIGPWEGNITQDDRYVVVTSLDEKSASVYDIKNNAVLGTRSFSSTFDWASMTPWGDYVVVSYRGTGDTRLYDLNFNFIRILSKYQSHADFAIDTEGNKVFVEMCPLRMVRIDNGRETDLLPETVFTSGICRISTYNPWVCGHVSGRCFSMPGWVLISAGIDDCNDGLGGYYNRTEIFYLKLDGSGTIKFLGHTRTDFSNYEAEAKAVISPDGSKAMFTSNWNVNGNGGDACDYVVEFAGNTSTIDQNNNHSDQENTSLKIYPNPFNPSTTISILGEQAGDVSIYDINGRLVYSINNVKQFDWNVDNMTSGIYIVKAQVGNKIFTKKITLIR